MTVVHHPATKATGKSSDNLSELVFQQIKNDIFDFKLMPGERFTESEIAETYAVSRTPIRQALYRLQQDGYVEVHFRSGWQVRPLNFKAYEELYDLRILLECYAVEQLCQMPEDQL
jgi:DNA-binding GntR family transcriptional regulator